MRRSCGRPRLRFWSARYEQIRRRGLPAQLSATACDACARPRTAQAGPFKDPASNHLCHSYSVLSRCSEGLATGGHDAGGGGRGRTADGAPAAAAPGETLEGAVSAAVAEDGRRLSETVEDGRGRSRVVEDGRRHGGRGKRSDKARRGPRDIYCGGGVAARGGGGVLPREPVRARPAVQDMLLQPRLLRGRLFS